MVDINTYSLSLHHERTSGEVFLHKDKHNCRGNSYPAVLGWVILLALLVTRLLGSGYGNCSGEADSCSLAFLSAFGCSPDMLPPTVASSPVRAGAVPLASCSPVPGPAGPGPSLWAAALSNMQSFRKGNPCPGMHQACD